MDLNGRCLVIRDILWEISNLYDLIEWMSMGDSPEDEPLIEKNEAAFFIWRNLTAMQIVHMDKLLDRNGKHSIQKVINLAKHSNKDVNFCWIEDQLKNIVDDYNKFDMSFVRNKYIAHRDIVEKEVEIHIHKFCTIKNGLNYVYNDFAKLLHLDEYEHANIIASNFQKVIGSKREI